MGSADQQLVCNTLRQGTTLFNSIWMLILPCARSSHHAPAQAGHPSAVYCTQRYAAGLPTHAYTGSTKQQPPLTVHSGLAAWQCKDVLIPRHVQQGLLSLQFISTATS